jgi:hypothetical protein
MDEPADAEGTPYRPQTAVEVARRTLILSAVVCRASIEVYSDENHQRQTADDIHEWLDELRLWPHVEPDEEQILHASFGTMSERLGIRGTWFVEGLAILSWALRRGEFPPHDHKVDPVAVTNDLDFLHPDAEKHLQAPTLRETAEVEAAREWFYDLHCTLRGFLFHSGNGCLANWIGQYLAVLAVDPRAVQQGNSLLYGGRPLRESERDRLQKWEWIICERHRAAIWLVGEDQLYTELLVDT